MKSFLRPVLASFIVCLLLSWAGAEFKSASALKLAQSAAQPPAVQKVIDATPPAQLAATVPGGVIDGALTDAVPEAATADDSVMSLLVAPQPSNVVPAVTKTSSKLAFTVTLPSPSYQQQGKKKLQQKKSSPVVPASGSSVGVTPINSPTLPGPTSTSAAVAPQSSDPFVLNPTDKFVSAELELPAAAVPGNELAMLAANSSALGSTVNDDAGGIESASLGSDTAFDTAVPEPSTLGLLALGCGGWMLKRRRALRREIN